MPEWIHNRAEHLLAKNPDMSKSKAFAIATQQSHALGKSPKGYGTAEGKREAKAKYDTPKGDVKKANPGNLDSPKMAEVNVPRLVSKYKNLPAEKLKQITERIGRAKEKLHGTKIYPLEGKLSPGGSLDMAGGETYWKGKAALESAQKRYTDLSKARHGAAQALFEREKGGSVYAGLRKLADLISGGRADDTSDKGFDRRQLELGEKVEQEHAKGNKTLAREISRDHLSEIPDYYTRLKKMEDAAPKNKTASEDDEEKGRAPTAQDKAAIEKFIAGKPGLKDEDYHEFLENKGIKVPLGEAAAYALLRERSKEAMLDELMKIALAQLEKDSGFLDSARKFLGREAPAKIAVKPPQGLLRNRQILEELKQKGLAKAPTYRRPDVIDPGFGFAGAPG